MPFLPRLARLGLLVALPLASLGQQTPKDEIAAIQAQSKAEFDRVTVTEENTLAPVKANYVKELGRLRDAAKSKGDLNTVLVFDAAIKAAGDGAGQLPAGQPPNAALDAARQTYERNKTAALRPFAQKRQQLEADYLRAITALEQRFTRAGQLEAALFARAAKADVPGGSVESIAEMAGKVLKGDDSVQSKASYQPPVEIEFTLTTDGQVRLGYACKQTIFNWEVNPNELRIDGGPASNQHKKGEGSLPTKKPVVIKLVVQRNQMSISVDGRERAKWTANFAAITQPISVSASHGSTVQIDRVIVRKR